MNRQRLIATLMRHEGKVQKHGRHVVYLDPVGVWTVGYGRNLEDRGLSESEARLMLENDIADSMAEIQQKYRWFSDLSNVRQEAVVELAFWLGMRGLGKFKRMIAALENADYDDAADEMIDSKAYRQAEARMTEISEMMRTGRHEH